MRVAFRTDASIEIGSGHVMRCLALADELGRRGAETYFVTRALPGHLAGLIHQRGHACALLPAPPGRPAALPASPRHSSWLGVPWTQDADETGSTLSAAGDFEWLVVDHYALAADWESRLRRQGRRILAIDDLADRTHDCDMLLDQNLQGSEDRYARLLPSACRRLLGPAYALLQPHFAAARDTRPHRDGTVRRILVFFGGSDPADLTGMTLAAIGGLGMEDLAVDVVVGLSNPRRPAIEEACAHLGHAVSHFNIPGPAMAALMIAADLAIGAAGVTTWERACVGLPALVVTLAENQRQVAACAQRSGILRLLGDVQEMTAGQIASALHEALRCPDALAAQSLRGRELVDGGGTGRVVSAMMA